MSEFKARRKVIIVGDTACGKTCLMIAYSKGTFPESDVPAVFLSYAADVDINGKSVQLFIWDTTSQEGYERLRLLSYPDSHLILICFAIDSPDSLNDIKKKWVVEVNHYCYRVPFILIGCKKDLRQDSKEVEKLGTTSQRLVTPEEGMAVAQKIGAKQYLECSAKSGEGVREVFQYAAQIARPIQHIHPRRGCVVA